MDIIYIRTMNNYKIDVYQCVTNFNIRRCVLLYAMEPIFWIKFFILIGILSLLLFGFNSIMRKHFKIEKRKTFSYNHVNEKHKKIDWSIRIIFVIISIMFLVISKMNNYNYGTIWRFIPSILLGTFVLISEAVRAFMEWKYAVNPKVYIFTISQIIFMLVSVALVVKLSLIILP